MDTTPERADIAGVLELFGYPADHEARKPMLAELGKVEQTARRLMRKPLRPAEFASVAALANAAASAQAILLHLEPRR